MEKEVKNILSAIKFTDYTINRPLFSLNNGSRWIVFGDNNLYPQFLIDLYKSSPTHGNALKQLALLVAGDGIVFGENVKLNRWIESAFGNVNEWIENVAQDFLIHNAIGSQVVWSNGGKWISKVKHLDVSKIRVGGEEGKMWVSRDWLQYNYKNSKPIEMFRYNPKIAKSDPVQILYSFKKSPGNDWYAEPSYEQSMNYITLDKALAEYYNNFVSNGFSASYLITMYGKPMNPDEMWAMQKEIERSLVGPKSAGQFLLQVAGNKEDKMDFEPLNTADNTKMFETMQRWGQQQVMGAHGITAPELIGASSGGIDLGGDANKLSVAYDLLQSQKIKPIQNRIVNEIIQLAKDSGILCSTEDIFISSSVLVKAIDMQVLTVNERRKLAGYEPIEGQDIILSSVRFKDQTTKMGAQLDYGCLMLDLQVEGWDDLKLLVDPEDVHDSGLDFGGIQEDPHVTVLFGYHDDVKPGDVMMAAEDIVPGDIELELNTLSVFENDEYDVLKFEVVSKELTDLNSKMKSKFNHTNTHTGYNPHVTLAYVKKGTGQKYEKVFQESFKAMGEKFNFNYKKGTKNLTWK